MSSRGQEAVNSRTRRVSLVTHSFQMDISLFQEAFKNKKTKVSGYSERVKPENNSFLFSRRFGTKQDLSRPLNMLL